jgi:hypothetical protein
VARTSASRINRDKIVTALREASRKGDRHALTVAIDQMRTLALSPRYWEKYLTLLKNPLARLVDLLVIKQGHRIAHQKGWKLRRPAGDIDPDPVPPKKVPRTSRHKPSRSRHAAPASASAQRSLFE